MMKNLGLVLPGTPTKSARCLPGLSPLSPEPSSTSRRSDCQKLLHCTAGLRWPSEALTAHRKWGESWTWPMCPAAPTFPPQHGSTLPSTKSAPVLTLPNF